MINEVIETIRKHDMFCYGERVIVGVSGGCDSVALLYILKRIPYDLSLHVVHVNHMLRGKNADMDAEYVRDICSKLDVGLTIISEDVKTIASDEGISVEEAGRNVRYNKFLQEAKMHNCTKIAVAHHRDDQAETMLMRLLRGSGLKGLIGMPESRKAEGINIVRPLINVRRVELERFCQSLGIVPRVDESNMDSKYLRNKIRNELIPLLKEEYNPSIVDTLIRSSKLLKEDQAYLEGVAKAAYFSCLNESGYLEVSELLKLHEAILRRVLIKVYEDTTKEADFTYAQIIGMEDLIKSNRMGSSVDLSKKFAAVIDYDGFKVQRRKENAEMEKIEFSPGEKVTWGGKIISSYVLRCSFSGEIDNKAIAQCIGLDTDKTVVNWAAFDLDKLSEPFIVRQKISGDRMIPFGMSSEKLLSDIFIDAKVSRDKRTSCPLVCSGSEILWLCGIKTSNVAKVTHETKTILILEFQDKGKVLSNI